MEKRINDNKHNIFYEHPYLWFYLSDKEFVERAKEAIASYSYHIHLPLAYNKEVLEKLLLQFVKEDTKLYGLNKWVTDIVNLTKEIDLSTIRFKSVEISINEQALWTDFYFFILKLKLGKYNYKFIDHTKEDVIRLLENVFSYNVTSKQLLQELLQMDYFIYLGSIREVDIMLQDLEYLQQSGKRIHSASRVIVTTKIILDNMENYNSRGILDAFYDDRFQNVSRKISLKSYLEVIKVLLNMIHLEALMVHENLHNIHQFVQEKINDNPQIKYIKLIENNQQALQNRKNENVLAYEKNKLFYKLLCGFREGEVSNFEFELKDRLNNLKIRFLDGMPFVPPGEPYFFTKRSPSAILKDFAFFIQQPEFRYNKFYDVYSDLAEEIYRKRCVLNSRITKTERSNTKRALLHDQLLFKQRKNDFENETESLQRNVLDLITHTFYALINCEKPLTDFKSELEGDINIIPHDLIETYRNIWEILEEKYLHFDPVKEYYYEKRRYHRRLKEFLKLKKAEDSTRRQGAPFRSKLKTPVESSEPNPRKIINEVKASNDTLKQLEEALELLYNEKYVGQKLQVTNIEGEVLCKLKRTKRLSTEMFWCLKFEIFELLLKNDSAVQLSGMKMFPTRMSRMLLLLNNFFHKNDDFYSQESEKQQKRIIHFIYAHLLILCNSYIKEIQSFMLNYENKQEIFFELSRKKDLEEKKLSLKKDLEEKKLNLFWEIYDIINLNKFRKYRLREEHFWATLLDLVNDQILAEHIVYTKENYFTKNSYPVYSIEVFELCHWYSNVLFNVKTSPKVTENNTYIVLQMAFFLWAKIDAVSLIMNREKALLGLQWIKKNKALQIQSEFKTERSNPIYQYFDTTRLPTPQEDLTFFDQLRSIDHHFNIVVLPPVDEDFIIPQKILYLFSLTYNILGSEKWYEQFWEHYLQKYNWSLCHLSILIADYEDYMVEKKGISHTQFKPQIFNTQESFQKMFSPTPFVLPDLTPTPFVLPNLTPSKSNELERLKAFAMAVTTMNYLSQADILSELETASISLIWKSLGSMAESLITRAEEKVYKPSVDKKQTEDNSDSSKKGYIRDLYTGFYSKITYKYQRPMYSISNQDTISIPKKIAQEIHNNVQLDITNFYRDHPGQTLPVWELKLIVLEVLLTFVENHDSNFLLPSTREAYVNPDHMYNLVINEFKSSYYFSAADQPEAKELYSIIGATLIFQAQCSCCILGDFPVWAYILKTKKVDMYENRDKNVDLLEYMHQNLDVCEYIWEGKNFSQAELMFSLDIRTHFIFDKLFADFRYPWRDNNYTCTG